MDNMGPDIYGRQNENSTTNDMVFGMFSSTDSVTQSAPAPAPAPVQVAPAPAAPANPIAASTGAVQPTIQQRPVITPVQSQQRISIVPNNINVTPDSGSTQ